MRVRVAPLPNGRLMLRYRVDGCTDLVIPPYRGIGRADELWKTTCCELFVYDGGGHYREFNFSPSGQWAGYAFSGYRNRDGEASLRDWPEIKHDTGASVYVQTVFLPMAIAGGAERAGLAMVIEEEGGRPSYWALAHNGLKPDFHDPACFTATLAAPAVS
ncbi:DOMON-like domain-containing protein [Croceibacterium aestuarii]|uniref:DOMON-like domain-containing protein n=1 Tax=Croceibacterium aestuarii TaxID=3064139 RepID=UPI00272E6909|nr:DOMON-like domain-containing protein [Croceibacterium sp. D39]